MRTTVNIDDDVLLAVQQRARQERRAAGQILSELARQSLTGTGQQQSGQGTSRHGFHPLPRRGVIISNALIDRLREDESE